MCEDKQCHVSDGRDSERKEILLYALQREDNLVNNRLIWVLTIQGFLFAAVALSKEKNIEPDSFVNIIGFMGLAISSMGSILSLWANKQIDGIRSQWTELKDVVQDVSPFGAGPHKSNLSANLFGLSLFLPIFTGVAWLLILQDENSWFN